MVKSLTFTSVNPVDLSSSAIPYKMFSYPTKRAVNSSFGTIKISLGVPICVNNFSTHCFIDFQ